MHILKAKSQYCFSFKCRNHDLKIKFQPMQNQNLDWFLFLSQFRVNLKALGLNFTLFFSQLGLSVRGREDKRFNILFTKR